MDQRPVVVLLSLVTFFWLNAVLLRTLHQWVGIPYEIEAVVEVDAGTVRPFNLLGIRGLDDHVSRDPRHGFGSCGLPARRYWSSSY